MNRRLKNLPRVIGRVLRFKRWRPEKGKERGNEYYDEAFEREAHFQCKFFESPYYATWVLVVDRLKRHGVTHVVDIGCGPGQFAAMIHDSGFKSYTGFDFSEVALKFARQQCPEFDFRIGDARDRAIYDGVPCDGIVCMEVLEHIEDDLQVVESFPEGARCLVTVPNFPWRSHVRHFKSEQAVSDRYQDCFDDLSITRIKGVQNDNAQFYLMDGIKRARRAD